MKKFFLGTLIIFPLVPIAYYFGKGVAFAYAYDYYEKNGGFINE